MTEKLTSKIIGQREKFLLYGAPKKGGKTFTALTAPEPILFHAIGGPNEAKTYFSKDFQNKHGPKDIIIDVVVEDLDKKGRCKNPIGFDNACNLLDEALEADDKGELPTETGGFETLVIDNGTVLSEFQMNKVIHIANSFRNAQAKGMSTYDKLMQEGILVPHDSDWGGAQSLMRDYVSWLFKLDKHVVFIAHEYEQTKANRATQSSDLIGIKPLFIGQQRDRIANMFDNVWRCTKQGQMYIARTIPADKPIDIIAGTRLGGIVDNDYIDPNITKTIEKFKKHAESIEKNL